MVSFGASSFYMGFRKKQCWCAEIATVGRNGVNVPTSNRLLDPSGDRLRAIFLLATLKHKRAGQEFSHTETPSQVVIECLSEYNVRSEIVRLVDHDIPAGAKSNMGKGDEWPGFLKKILAADIIVFATPIWWGNQSSLIQRVIERLDELHNELLETGKSRLTNKVGGIVITGEEDGEQQITAVSHYQIPRYALQADKA